MVGFLLDEVHELVEIIAISKQCVGRKASFYREIV
jgi:hypothetical protein